MLDAYEAEIVRKAFELYAMDGETASSVTEHLNNSMYVRKDSKSGMAKSFTQDFVSTILTNPIYCGKLVFGRRTNRKDHNGKVIKYGLEHAIIVKGNHDAIVSEELWNQVQEKRGRLSEKYRNPTQNVHTHILSGLVKCPVCRNGLIGTANRSGKANKYGVFSSIAYYECAHSGKRYGRECSFTRKLNQEIIDGLVLELVCRFQYYDDFRVALQNAFGTADSVESKEKELKKLRKALRDAESSKDRIGQQLDDLNPLNAGYDRKYSALSSRLDDAYDRIDATEAEIDVIRKQIEVMRKRTGTLGEVSRFLSNLGGYISEMTPQEKKELCRSFIERVDLFPEERPDGRLIKSICLRFPLAFDGMEPTKSNDAEGHVSFVFDCSEIDIHLPSKGRITMKRMNDGSQKVIVNKPTYPAIKDFVLSHFGTKVSSLYIAQTKRKHGLDVGESYNKPRNGGSRVPICPPEKEKMIVDALVHFGLMEQTTAKEGKRI